METTEKLFSEFTPVDKEQWKAKAIEDLKGADFDKKLVWKTDDEFPIQPFYTEEDLREKELLKARQQLLAQAIRKWVNYTQVPVTDPVKANALASEMVSLGATGILFNICDPQEINFTELLKGLDLEQLHISFSTKEPDTKFLADYFSYLKQAKVSFEKIKGFYAADILENWITEGSEPSFDSLAEILRTVQVAPGFKGLVINSHAFTNAGSNTIQEIAFTLNKLTEYLEILSLKGLTTSAIANHTLLHMAIGGDYFFEIAKLRALKVLVKSLLNLYDSSAPIEILSSNSIWSKSFYDPNVNMLRNTTEAMSALLGGCDALLTYPHDQSFAEPTQFSQRIALNISNLLKEESYFDKVVDPAAGSYYLESLTEVMAERALALFKVIEEAGGFIGAFKAGVIQQKIGTVKNKKEKEIASRRRVYVGTNKYPNLKEKAILQEESKREPKKDGLLLLAPQRAVRCFEELRTKTLKHFEATGFIPGVYLACFGNLAMRKARATFASEFFGTAGFKIMGEYFFSDPQKAAEESALSTADIVVICSSDQDYEAGAVAFAEKFKSISENKILVLAGYPEKIVDELRTVGLDAFIHIKSDAVQVLSEFQSKLFK